MNMLRRTFGRKSSRSQGTSSSNPSAEASSSSAPMEHDEEEEYTQPQQMQSVDMEIDDEDAHYLDIRDDRERQAYAMLKNRVFQNTWQIDPDLLEKIGMNFELYRIRQALGWISVSGDEKGSRLLTIQFICTLREVPDGITFRLFGTDRHLTWRILSDCLGFDSHTSLHLEQACISFQRHNFWKQIFGQAHVRKFTPKCNSIIHPSLQFFHKWMAITFFSRGDPSTVRNDELMILYAAVNKIKVSPVIPMIRQWLSNFRMLGPISCTSLISCIASMVKNLEEYNIPFLEEERPTIDESYLIQGHILKKGLNDSLIFFYPGYTNEISLLDLSLHLCSGSPLVFPLTPQEEARRTTCSRWPGRMTRSRARRVAEQQQEQQQQPQPQPQVTPPIQEGWSPNIVPDPAWEQAVYLRSLGRSSWQTGSSGAWAQCPQHSSTPETAPSKLKLRRTTSYSRTSMLDLNS